MDFSKLAQIRLIKGAGGGDPRNGLCIMEMVSYFDGADPVTDQPACACRALTAAAIRLNDSAPSQEERDTLKPLLPLLTGSVDDGAIKARVAYLVFETARRIVAPVFEKRWPQHAKAIREAATYANLQAAAQAAKKAASAYAYAAAAASAYAAAAAADAKRQYWCIGRDILIEAIQLGKHGGLDLEAPQTEARVEQLLALIGTRP